MISWISYTTATVSATFQGMSFSRWTISDSGFPGNNTYTFTLPSYTITKLVNPTLTIKSNGKNSRWVSTGREKNFETRYDGDRDFPTQTIITDPESTVGQLTTYLSDAPTQSRKTTTKTGEGQVLNWVTTVVNGLSSVISRYESVATTLEETYDHTFFDTILALKETVGFVTWTGLSVDQIVVGHTIYEDSRGFAFFTYGTLNEVITPSEMEGFSSDNSGWSPISTISWRTATRTTSSQTHYYIKLHSFESKKDVAPIIPTRTRYGVFRMDWAGAGQALTPFATHTAFLSDYGQNLPFSTVTYEYGEVIYKFNTLERVVTSTTEVYSMGIQTNTSYSGSNINAIIDGLILVFDEMSMTSHGKTSGEVYQRMTPELKILRAQAGVVFYAARAALGFGRPDLDFSQSTFSTYPLFLELTGHELTLNDIDIEYPAVYGDLNDYFMQRLDVPFALPSFTAHAKPESGEERSEWTTVTVERVGASFSSSWVWNVNSSSTRSSSGKAGFQTKNAMTTGVQRVFVGNEAIVLGGAQFPHATVTSINNPNVLLMTTYNSANSGTLSSMKKDYSAATTAQLDGDPTLTIFRSMPFVMGYGMLTYDLLALGLEYDT